MAFQLNSGNAADVSIAETLSKIISEKPSINLAEQYQLLLMSVGKSKI
ncbi:hypothetical protein PRO82_001430 [Candidatus Protochlamydia amoebophila]|nr:hypothetical protein [Candidatus Protochlamydia amoebophila]